MLEFFKKVFGQEDDSKDIAKQRLQFVLVQDRIKLSPQQTKDLKRDLLEVISKYIDIDDQNIEMEINRKEDMMALLANFPVHRARSKN
ncbi:MAG: cell division topological specificity factor MinE [bacterium]